MQIIYKIIFLIIILLFINYLHPLKNHFSFNNLLNQFNKNKKQITIIYKYINNLIIKDIDYNEFINYKWNIKPTPINNILNKIIIDYINNLFNNSQFNGNNIELLNNVASYNSHKGCYIPNIQFKITINNINEKYIYFMDIELFIHNNNKIDVINVKIIDVINSEHSKINSDSVFLNIQNNETISEDSLIPTINNID